MVEKIRTKRVEIRLFEEEYNKLINDKDCAKLAEYVRKKALANNYISNKKNTGIDNKTARVWAGIGNNINQLAKMLNTFKNNTDLLAVLIELNNIEQAFNTLKKMVRDNK